MRKTFSAVLAALTVAGGALAAGAADARPHDYYGGYYNDGRYRHRDRSNNDAALVAGIAGLAIGAALASSSGGHRYYDRGDYGRSYYDRPRHYGGYYGAPAYAYDGYGYDSYRYAPRRCSTRTYWDPYADSYVRRTTCW